MYPRILWKSSMYFGWRKIHGRGVFSLIHWTMIYFHDDTCGLVEVVETSWLTRTIYVITLTLLIFVCVHQMDSSVGGDSVQKCRADWVWVPVYSGIIGRNNETKFIIRCRSLSNEGWIAVSLLKEIFDKLTRLRSSKDCRYAFVKRERKLGGHAFEYTFTCPHVST